MRGVISIGACTFSTAPTFAPTPRCRSGAGKRGSDQALGRSQGGFGTKLHLRVERRGKPITFTLTPGQANEQPQVPRLLAQGAVKRPGRGRPRLRPKRVGADKGYASGAVRRYLRRRGIGAGIPAKRGQRRHPHFDRAAYRERNVVERCVNRLKQFRAIATRYDKLEASFHALVTLACIVLWL